jgi:membrane associated rhomboid family serine protease
VIEYRANPFPPVVRNLVIINVLFFLATLFFESKGESLALILGMFYIDSPQFEPFQVLTHMFMHGSLMHIFFNMFGLWMFGGPLENVWGPKRFLTFYFVCGLWAAFLHQAVTGFEVYQMTSSFFPGIPGECTYDNEYYSKLEIAMCIPTVGASGALFGILAGFAMLFPNTRLMLIFFPVPIKAKYFVLIYMAIEIYLGFQRLPGDNIAHFAHIGGALFGFVLVKIWQRTRKRFY